MLLPIPAALLRSHIFGPSGKRVIVLTGNQAEINVSEIIILADAPDLERLAELLPVEAKYGTLRITHDAVKNAFCILSRRSKVQEILLRTLVIR